MIKILYLTGFLLVIGALFGMFLMRNTSQEARKQKVALSALSTIWSKKQGAMVSLHELARLWRQDAEIVTEQVMEVSYQNRDIQAFYENQLLGKTFFTGNTRVVIQELLGILDKEGDCPSVVNNYENEIEGRLDKHAYDILAQVTLTAHTLHTAEEILKLFPSAALASKAIITALAHDIGKIPSFRGKLYSMGDHPLISVAILEGLKGFSELNAKDEILKAIRDHHRKVKGFLVEKLKEADQSARRMEMSEKARLILKEENFQEEEESDCNVENAIQEAQSPPKGVVQAQVQPEKQPKPMQEDVDASRAEIFGSANAEVVVKEVPLNWLEDPEEVIEALKPYINKLYGAKWEAFSMPDGIVYFQVKTVWEVIKKIARSKGHLEALLGDADEELRRNMIYSVVQVMKREKDAIARGLIQDKYFSAPFIVKMQDGKEYKKAIYIPFNAEIFAATVSELENNKKGRIKEIVEVVPQYEKVAAEQCSGDIL